ncbi:MAG: DNA replication/repair protein RecF [Halieaceae bacterium]|nr:DNA replication/repair protein RecF [Halieaceae bacterium]
MSLERLDIRGVRNLSAQSLRDLRQVNVFFGVNGSGKTSLLESIHLLGLARSFRTAHIKSVISHGQNDCTVYGEIAREQGPVVSVGVRRERDGNLDARVAGTPVKARAELAQVMPLQLVHADSFGILTGAPIERRQFLDWGVFHVEHQFLAAWQHFQKAIKQRNSLLRHGKINEYLLRPWDEQLAVAGEQIDASRAAYLTALKPVFEQFLQQLSPHLQDVELRYRRGWDRDLALVEALEQSRTADVQQGYTHIGPQRADIRVVFEGKPAADNLSRGQLKLVICALKLAAGELLQLAGHGPCIYLVDDLTAELDIEHCRQVATMLGEMQVQQFVTCIQRKDVEAIWRDIDPSSTAMFHVEHGDIQRLPAE